MALLTINKGSNFQSRVGGLISVVLGSLSLANALCILVLWTKNNMPSNINTKKQTTGYVEFKWSESSIFLLLQDFTSFADPF
ncbi:unnamed protein product [Paramecium primaurelia]|uniref:Uncharacterized protein n=1 Tax=Paramecium primaurelia TaxID=5886 RepID=A0A8S1NH88_PARPR|nr:unnamed protein product [Paramecium primaurelia]